MEIDNDVWKQAQRRDEDLAPIIRGLEESSERPNRQEVASESPVAKHLWQQWPLLRIEDGILQRRWVDARKEESHWVIIVPRTLR